MVEPRPLWHLYESCKRLWNAAEPQTGGTQQLTFKKQRYRLVRNSYQLPSDFVLQELRLWFSIFG